MGNVIARYKIGNTKITICDDYCVKTDEERKQILENVSKIFGRCYTEGMVIKDEPMAFPEKLIKVDENWEMVT